MQDRVVLATGGSYGIGAATSRLFGSLGATVVVRYQRDRAAANAVRSTIGACGGLAMTARANLVLSCDVAQMASTIRLAVGDIDTVVINSSAEALSGPVLGLSFAAYEDMMSSEAASATHLCRAFATAMRAACTGRVVAAGGEVSRTGVNEAARIARCIPLSVRSCGKSGPMALAWAASHRAAAQVSQVWGAGHCVARPAQAADLDAAAAAVAAAYKSLSHLSAARPPATNGARPS